MDYLINESLDCIEMNIARYIDHTLLKPTALKAEYEKLCSEARQYQFAAICIPPNMVETCTDWVSGTGIQVATVIGFPFGYSVSRAKKAEAESAIKSGADELDTVINLIDLKNGHWNKLEKEMQEITELVHKNGRKIKVIIESGILNDEEIITCCQLYGGMGVDFLKTSTGYSDKGASTEAVALMKSKLPASVLIKASGGIRTFEFAIQLIRAGAIRLGCSASVSIVNGAPKEENPTY
jgi:deoxyribose-phosphate aldolase